LGKQNAINCSILDARGAFAMNRFAFAVAALAFLSPGSVAEETVISLSVQPMQAPKPALRYMLLPELAELSPGNPIHGYLKCALEEHHFFFDKEQFDNREALLALPLSSLPLEELGDHGSRVLARLDQAARLDNPDWQILLKLKEDGIGTLLPDLQQTRDLARALQVRFRTEVAISQFDDAIRTAKTMFAMSRHLDRHPTLIGNLVGIAVANLAIPPLDEMLAQPGCPNLFWALTNLPAPLMTCENGRAGERLTISTVFKKLDSKAPMSAAELKEFIDPLDALLEDGAKPGSRIRKFLDERSKNPARMAAVKARLMESGLSEKALRTFPADQLILLDEQRECQARLDDITKTMAFPAWQVEKLA
jgi:hypothetical protein